MRFGLVLMCCVATAACDDGAVISVDTSVQLLLSAGSLSLVPNGYLVPVQVSAFSGSVPVLGLSVGLSSSMMGVTLTPASATTDSSGTTTVEALVPFGAQTIVSATATGGAFADVPLSAGPISLSLTTEAPTVHVPGGELVTMIAHATAQGLDASGVSLTFTTNVSGVTFAPSPVVTDGDGKARAIVDAPYSATPLVATVAGGGASQLLSLSPLLSPLTVSLTSTVGPPASTGTNYEVTATVAAQDGTPVSGVAVAFAQYGTSANSNPFTPASSTTDSQGHASSFVTFATPSLLAVVTVAGVPAECPVPAPPTGEVCH